MSQFGSRQAQPLVRPVSFISALATVLVLGSAISAWGICHVGSPPGFVKGGFCVDGTCRNDRFTSAGAECADSTQGYGACDPKTETAYTYTSQKGGDCNTSTGADANPCVINYRLASFTGGVAYGSCGGGT